MANYFKSDDSFLKKIAVGAAGTNATISQLKQMGFIPIELERGSTGFKIWKKIKIKRVRVPDILCLKTGLRFESRGKTKPEISMSHSLRDPKRAWDAGMRENDDIPIDLKQVSPVHFVSVREMRHAFSTGQYSITKPKGVEEGSEIRVIWTSSAANLKSNVTEVEPGRISLTPIPEARRQTIRLNRSNGINLLPQVQIGDTVEANQIVASVVPVHIQLTCPPPVDETYFIERLTNVNMSERYAASKALRYSAYSASAKAMLEARMNDSDEDIYVQLEAAAALAARNHQNGWDFLENKLRSTIMAVPLEIQLETVIVTSEIPNERSEQLLIEVLRDAGRDDELRAGAAWALGQFASSTSATALVDTFDSSTLYIKVEAARALLRIAEPQIPHLINLLKSVSHNKRDGISWALARTGNFNPADLVENADENLRKWISYIVGYGKENFDQSDIETICNADPEIYFAASVLWQILTSWVNDLREY